MLLAQYGWAVGADWAFVLLLLVATLGVIVFGVVGILRLADSRRMPNALLLLGFLQAWFAFLAMRLIEMSPKTIEWLWLTSFCIVIASFLLVFKRRPASSVSRDL